MGHSKASLIVHRELFDIIILIRASDSTYQTGDDDFFDNSSSGVKVLKSTVRRFLPKILPPDAIPRYICYKRVLLGLRFDTR